MRVIMARAEWRVDLVMNHRVPACYEAWMYSSAV
jgi:hypothetical protein